MAEGWRAWLSAWDDFASKRTNTGDLDDERVLVFFRMFGRGKTSGIDLAEMHPLIAPGYSTFGKAGSRDSSATPTTNAPSKPSGCGSSRQPSRRGG